MTLCARCDEPIHPSHAIQVDIDGGSGAGGTVWVHARLCTPVLVGRPYPLPRR